ncbi:hypothetical protein AVEN_75080-1 [Araneus ventricosus]|uniref:Reverse transcriptase domain-containing protein n=1 Tax=Araneus ventricosus TaxID=182803 RepID=A0A4Y2PYA3_ARAVE|nr:hypothetical protein AVEN_75080-1 [Araneus ventricosus]
MSENRDTYDRSLDRGWFYFMYSDNPSKSEHAPSLVVTFMQDGAPPHFHHEDPLRCPHHILQQMSVTTILYQPTEDWSYSPLFKKKGKNKSDIKSYLLVSLLPTLGKILEKLLLERLNHHLRRNNIQHPNQYGFRTNRSTEEAILDLLDKINSAKNSNQHALMISLDIKGAFEHLQYTWIKDSLDNLEYHTKHPRIDILSNRKVVINISQGPATRMPPRLFHRPSFLEPGGRRSSPAMLVPKGFTSR